MPRSRKTGGNKNLAQAQGPTLEPDSMSKATEVLSAQTSAQDFLAYSEDVLKRMQYRYCEKEDSAALLEAVKWCFEFNIEAPAWVRVNFNRSLMKFWNFKAATLDDAFGVKRSKDPRTVAAGKRAVTLTGEITRYIWDEQAKRTSLTEEFFEDVGKEFNIGKSKVKEYWRAGQAAFGIPSKRPRTKKRGI